ncbi:DNA/RNA-binding protein KIN17-like [Tubulanus polymorphus]|uniref:DNA/RNA-binding protein KIN17-like n=1 Tax=Tubulanus polymorphus TaxID=672921 RepID=UPI003DA44FF2
MGKEKGGFLTPKAIANRIKAKGLQKLRWYCQMCQKQCRDENGFKCHLMSESHQRQLLLFAENPHTYIDSFSKEFLDGYIELLKRRFGTKRVNANQVYQEYISYREHVHMNATKWLTLTEFVQWLGKEGHCTVDETEKGWFVQYIDRDPETIKRQEALKNKEKMELDDEERNQKFVEEQMKRAAATEKSKPQAEFTELKRDNEEEKVAFSFGGLTKQTTAVAVAAESAGKIIVKTNALETLKSAVSEPSASGSKPTAEKRKSALDDIITDEENMKEKRNRKDFWLHEGIVVKIVAKKLGEKFYKRKGVIQKVEDQFTGVVKMNDSGDKLRIDQTHLETVIPAIGKTVLIVNGAYRNTQAKLVDINEKKFCSTLKISQGPLKGRVLVGIPYEDFSKLDVK